MAKKSPDVIIEIRGGCLSVVHAKKDPTVVVIDWDHIEEDRDELPWKANTAGFDELDESSVAMLKKAGYRL
jgi:hypothetical protein